MVGDKHGSIQPIMAAYTNMVYMMKRKRWATSCITYSACTPYLPPVAVP
jgi:hypothetical protein